MKRWLLTLMFMICCQGIGTASAAELFGTVDALSGTASSSDSSGSGDIALAVGSQISAGQTVTTGHDAELHIVTQDGAFLALRPDTTFRVDEYQADGDADADKVFMTLLKGSLRSITGWIGKYNTRAYRLTTPTAVIGIRGTDHETTVIEESGTDEAGTYDTVNEGKTVLSNEQGETEVTPGKHAFASIHNRIAPLFLSKRPYFWLHRAFRIEGRIAARKASLFQHIEQLRNARRQARLSTAADSRIEKKQARRERIQERRADRVKNRKKRMDADN